MWVAHAFEMELLWMAVDPQSTRRGIGRQLVVAAMDTVCTQQVVSLKTTDPDTVPNGSTLSAAGFRETVGFFQHLGFRIGARLGGYWGSGTDAMLLFKELR
ncbi:MAG: GNAT family N-acetyltransferase [Phycisphaerales bacterium]|nr:GNAT family N-acetyltransferase [Phycisphaerales bacterium]